MEQTGEDLIAQQEQTIERMKEEQRQLFDELGISESALLDALHDKSRFTPETWKKLQAKRRELEDLIGRHIQVNVSKPIKRREPANIKGHWIKVT